MGASLSHGKPLDVGRIGISQEQLPPLDHGPIDLQHWFTPTGVAAPGPDTGQQRAVELEIGCGKGTFVVHAAALHPRINYVGIEYAKAYWRYTADRCRRHGLDNVRLVHIEAGVFVRNYVPDASLRQVHIYFPDPWPKARHHKRRLIQEAFLRQLHRVLEPAGQVSLATDHADYYQWMLEHAAAVADLFEPMPFRSPLTLTPSRADASEASSPDVTPSPVPAERPGGDDDELVGTNFERKYRREGRSFHAMLLRKR
jgi:tRNA (guanine-N7-)-methyltransferase